MQNHFLCIFLLAPLLAHAGQNDKPGSLIFIGRSQIVNSRLRTGVQQDDHGGSRQGQTSRRQSEYLELEQPEKITPTATTSVPRKDKNPRNTHASSNDLTVAGQTPSTLSDSDETAILEIAQKRPSAIKRATQKPMPTSQKRPTPLP